MTAHEFDPGRLPRLETDTRTAGSGPDDRAGAVWRLEPEDRELDANLISLPAGDGIAEHAGADVDVLLHVVAGSGVLHTAGDDLALEPGAVVYLPRGARRGVLAGAEGLRYLSVHRRKETRPLMPTRR